MPHLSRPDLSDDESDASSELPEIFSNEASETDSATTSGDCDDEDESESEDDLPMEDEEKQLPPEHYLQEAECLDVSQLRQKRYSPRTQDKLDETRDIGIGERAATTQLLQLHLADCSRFCKGGKRDPVECFSWLSDTEETIRFFKALFSWRCDQRRGKNGRRTPGVNIKARSRHSGNGGIWSTRLKLGMDLAKIP